MKKNRRKHHRQPPRHSRVSWPIPIQRDMAEWTPQQVRAFAIYPAITGIGAVYRQMSDEDYVAMARDAHDAFGPFPFWADFLEVLELSADCWLGPVAPEHDHAWPYPESRVELKLPLPSVTYRPAGEGEDDWTAEHVEAMVLNPTYAGIGAAPMIERERWVSGVVRACREHGFEQTIVNVLYSMRKSYGFPGGPKPLVPFGYRKRE